MTTDFAAQPTFPSQARASVTELDCTRRAYGDSLMSDSVRSFNDEDITPLDMVVRNGMSRYHLRPVALPDAARSPSGASVPAALGKTIPERHADSTREHLEDTPEVRDWKWHTAP
jgi:phosphoketolase